MKPIGWKRDAAPSSDEAYRRECLVWQFGLCTGTPVCLRCGLLRQAFILGAWFEQAWPNYDDVVRPPDEGR